MRPDAVDLRSFYGTSLGQFAADRLARHIARLWDNDLRGMRVGGYGFAGPVLDRLPPGAERVLSFAPAGQGVVRWPPRRHQRVALVHGDMLPLPDSALDRIVMIHAIEQSLDPAGLLHEIWRVLTPTGKLVVVAPNRVGLWARLDKTPFGHGRPFSELQLRRLMRDGMLQPERWGHALFTPPLGVNPNRGAKGPLAAPLWEQMGKRFWPGFGGVIVMEASKQVHAISAPRNARPVRARRLIPIMPEAAGQTPLTRDE